MRIDKIDIFFFKQKTAYEVGTGDWSSDVCSSDLDMMLLLLLFVVEFARPTGFCDGWILDVRLPTRSCGAQHALWRTTVD